MIVSECVSRFSDQQTRRTPEAISHGLAFGACCWCKQSMNMMQVHMLLTCRVTNRPRGTRPASNRLAERRPASGMRNADAAGNPACLPLARAPVLPVAGLSSEAALASRYSMLGSQRAAIKAGGVHSGRAFAICFAARSSSTQFPILSKALSHQSEAVSGTRHLSRISHAATNM